MQVGDNIECEPGFGYRETLDAGAWCVVYPNWDETDELDVVKDVPDDE